MTGRSLETTQKNQASYSNAHIVKRKKMLLGDVACLTDCVVKSVVIKCATKMNYGLAPSFILASLFTGRSLKQLLEAKFEVPPEKQDGQMNRGFYLLSKREHPVLTLPSKYLSYFKAPDSKGEVLLPIELLLAFQKSRDQNITLEQLTSEVDEFKLQNFDGLFQHINLTRIQNYISHCAPRFALSRADVAFIADYDLADFPHCSYGLFDAGHVSQKHVRYISSLTKGADCFGFQIRSIDKKSFFGSHRVLKDSSVSDFFIYCVQQINRSPVTHAELVQSFNFYTFYVVSFLELCTLHRPILSEFGKLENFDLTTGSVVITDKGPQSSRVIPLSKTACNVLSAYFEYLKNLIRDLRFTNPEISNSIAKSLTSESNFFQFLGGRGITAYHPNLMYSLVESLFPFPPNWARHYISTVLIEKGVSRNKLEVFMGHAPAPDQIYNECSSFDFDSNRALSEKIESHITEELNLPLVT